MQAKNNLVKKIMSGVSGLALLVGLEGCGHNIVAQSYTPPPAYSANDMPSGSDIRNYLTRILDPNFCNVIWLNNPDLACLGQKCTENVYSSKEECTPEQRSIKGESYTRWNCRNVSVITGCERWEAYTMFELSREKKCLGVSAEIMVRDDNKFEDATITVNYLVEPATIQVLSSAKNARELADFVSKYYCTRN